MPDGGLALVVVRAVFVAGLLSLGGTVAFGAVAARPALARAPAGEAMLAWRMLDRLVWLSLGVCLLALPAWMVLQAASIAGAEAPLQGLAVLPAVLGGTAFGHLALLQLVLLGATGALLYRGPVSGRAGVAVAMLDVVLQAGHGHAMAMEGGLGPLCLVDALHLLAAAAWIGGLLPLLLVVRRCGCPTGAQAARWFSPMGRICVAVLGATSLLQGWVLVGSLPALFGRPYGWVVLVKTALFLLLTGLALLNRYRLAPALRGPHPDAARRRLVASILLQTCLGLGAVLAASWLSGLTPGMDMGQDGS